MYDILAKLYLLESNPKDNNKYYCPVCNGNDLGVDKVGKYQCFNGCDVVNIRKAIDELECKTDNFKKKKVAKKSEQTWFYPDRDGKPLAAVKRVDDGLGNRNFRQGHYKDGRLINGNPEHIRKQIAPYNYASVQQAIKGGKDIWWVEGEKAVDVLQSLGMVATTTIGGSGGFSSYGDYSKDFDDAKVIICPDKDPMGLKYAAEVAAMLGDRVVGYYLCGQLGAWKNPGGGMDVVDEIVDHKYSSAQLRQRVISPERFTAVIGSIGAKQISLVAADDEDLPLLSEQIFDDWDEARKLPSYGHDVSNYFPAQLALALTASAEQQCIDPISYVAYLLPIVSSLIGNTALQVTKSWAIPNIVWTALIQKSGGGKSRADSLCKKQLVTWERESYVNHKSARGVYETNLLNAKKQGNFMGEGMPVPPVRRRYLAANATMGSIEKIIVDSEVNAICWIKDEINSLLKGFNRFGNGDSGEREIFLELWNGAEVVTDRIDESRSGVASASRVSVAGGMQPELFSDAFGETDPQGFFARFIPVVPKDRPRMFIDGEPELARELAALYRSLKGESHGSWPTISLSDEAKASYKVIYEGYGAMRSKVPAHQNWLHKAPDHVARVAIALHCIECAYDQAKGHSILEADTLCKAAIFVEAVEIDVRKLTGVASEKPDEQNPIVDKILAVLADYPQGLDVRGVMRKVRAIETAARTEKTKQSEFARKILHELASKGLIGFDGKVAKLN